MSVYRRHLGKFFVCLAAILILPLANAADFGAITGLVKDARQLPVAGATVTAVRQDGNGVRSTISNSDGIYSFSDVVPGTWAIIVQTEGNPDFTGLPLTVVAGRGARADLLLSFALAPAPAMAVPANTNPTAPDATGRSVWTDPAANAPRSTSSANAPSSNPLKRWLRGETITWADMETKKPAAQPV